MGLAFFEQLDRVVAGSLGLEPVISSFLGGLEAMMADFEEAADDDSSSVLARLFDAVIERFHETHGLACDLLEEPGPGELEKLKRCHERLEQALLRYHEACWVERGPTGACWANQIVEGLECFLEGESLAPELGALLDSLVLSCEKRGAHLKGQAGPGRDLLLLLRPIADWARGSVILTPSELRECVQRLPGLAVRAEEWLAEAEDRSLDRLLSLLDGKPTADETLTVAHFTLAEVERQLVETRLALAESRGDTAALIGDVEETLCELEGTLRSLIADVAGPWEWDFRDQIRDLREHLAEHMEELETVSRSQDQDSLIDFKDADAEAPEGENVRRLRLAVQAFSEGTLDLGGLQLRVKQLVALAARARAAMPAPSAEGLETRDRDRLEALDGIDAALGALGDVADPQEAALWSGLDGFVLNARRLGDLNRA